MYHNKYIFFAFFKLPLSSQFFNRFCFLGRLCWVCTRWIFIFWFTFTFFLLCFAFFMLLVFFFFSCQLSYQIQRIVSLFSFQIFFWSILVVFSFPFVPRLSLIFIIENKRDLNYLFIFDEIYISSRDRHQLNIWAVRFSFQTFPSQRFCLFQLLDFFGLVSFVLKINRLI